MATLKKKALATALRYSNAFLKSLKVDVDDRKLQDRLKILAAEKYELSEYAARISVAGKAQKVLNRIGRALREGQLDANDLDVKKLKEIVGEGLSEHRARLLMRNTLGTAYNAGYRAQGLADKTKHFWLYETRGDERVRPAHARWNRLLLPKGSTLAARICPLNGHNCRCKMTAVSRADAKLLIENGEAHTKVPELTEKTYVDKATGKTLKTLEGVDPGWEGPPADNAKALTALLERSIKLARQELS